MAVILVVSSTGYLLAFVPKPWLRYARGVLAKYARLVSDASLGAVTSAFDYPPGGRPR